MAAAPGPVAHQRLAADPRSTPRRLERTASPVLCPITALAFYRYGETRATEHAAAAAAGASSLLVLAGEDGWLAVYGAGEDDSEGAGGSTTACLNSFSERRCYGRLRVFAEQAIQGCRVGGGDREGDDTNSNEDVLVWGGRSVALVTRDHIAQLLAVSAGDAEGGGRPSSLPAVAEIVAPDWIYDGLLPRGGKSGGGGIGALITAHNEVIPFRAEAVGAADLDGSSPRLSPSLVLLGPPISPSRPVLYSAQLAWAGSDDSRLLVAAGTVFGEIVVWTCRLPAADGPATSPIGGGGGDSGASSEIEVLQVFEGHEGSIFDVALSPELDLGKLLGGDAALLHRNVRLLATCSDDRTIRIWPLYLPERNSGSERDAVPLDGDAAKRLAETTNEARETGFQNTFEGLDHRSDEAAEARVQAGASEKYLQSTDSSSSAALAVAMAHASRIWHVRFSASTESAEIYLYSFGEDAAAQEWRLELTPGQTQREPLSYSSSGLSGKLVHLRTLSSHSGKNIWSAAVSPPRTTGRKAFLRGPLVATGGCDGKICLFEGKQGRQQASGCEEVYSPRLPATVVSSTVPPKAKENQSVKEFEEVEVITSQLDDEGAPKVKKGSQKKFRQEVFNNYAFLSDNQLLAATTHGRLLLGDFRQTSGGTASLEWAELPGVSDAIVSSLQNYNVVRSPRGGGGGGVATVPGVEGLAFVGNATGELLMFSAAGGLQALTAKLPGKVDEIFFLPHAADAMPAGKVPDHSVLHLQIIATTLFRDEAALLDLDVDVARGTLLLERAQTLKLPKKAPTSPASMTITAASRCLEYIVLGSRNGHLCLCSPVVGGDATATAYVLETQLQTRTRDGILSIVPLPPRPGYPPLSSSSFVVTARDGTYRIYAIEKADATESSTPGSRIIRLQHETATPFGPIVRDARFIPSETKDGPPELVICGFQSTNFVVWNETRQQELATVDCGGTHRAHTYVFCSGGGGDSDSQTPKTANPGRVRFAFTRHSELHIFAQDDCTTSPLKTGGHGREIRAVSASENGTYIATGGEDTVVRIWSNPGTATVDGAERPERRCLSVLKLHNTGLHSVVWLGDDCLVSAAGSEELFLWRITTIRDSAYDGLAVLCESAYPDSTSDKVLRIIGLDATADPDDPGAMFISVGLSNSVLKTYRYAKTGRWQLLSLGHYTGACPTHLRHLQLRLGQELVTLAAFADGHLSVWRASLVAHEGRGRSTYSDYSLLCATPAHRNAVKGLDLTQFSTAQQGQPSSSAAVFTGGDDSAIAVTSLTWSINEDQKREYAFGKTFRVSGAHAAAITGVRILEGEADEASSGGFTAVSCSNDQRIKAWRVSVSDMGIRETKGSVSVQLLDDQYSAVADPGDLENIGGKRAASAMVVGMGMETWSLG